MVLTPEQIKIQEDIKRIKEQQRLKEIERIKNINAPKPKTEEQPIFTEETARQIKNPRSLNIPESQQLKTIKDGEGKVIGINDPLTQRSYKINPTSEKTIRQSEQERYAPITRQQELEAAQRQAKENLRPTTMKLEEFRIRQGYASTEDIKRFKAQEIEKLPQQQKINPIRGVFDSDYVQATKTENQRIEQKRKELSVLAETKPFTPRETQLRQSAQYIAQKDYLKKQEELRNKLYEGDNKFLKENISQVYGRDLGQVTREPTKRKELPQKRFNIGSGIKEVFYETGRFFLAPTALLGKSIITVAQTDNKIFNETTKGRNLFGQKNEKPAWLKKLQPYSYQSPQEMIFNEEMANSAALVAFAGINEYLGGIGKKGYTTLGNIKKGIRAKVFRGVGEVPNLIPKLYTGYEAGKYTFNPSEKQLGRVIGATAIGFIPKIIKGVSMRKYKPIGTKSPFDTASSTGTNRNVFKELDIMTDKSQSLISESVKLKGKNYIKQSLSDSGLSYVKVGEKYFVKGAQGNEIFTGVGKPVVHNTGEKGFYVYGLREGRGNPRYLELLTKDVSKGDFIDFTTVSQEAKIRGYKKPFEIKLRDTGKFYDISEATKPYNILGQTGRFQLVETPSVKQIGKQKVSLLSRTQEPNIKNIFTDKPFFRQNPKVSRMEKLTFTLEEYLGYLRRTETEAYLKQNPFSTYEINRKIKYPLKSIDSYFLESESAGKRKGYNQKINKESFNFIEDSINKGFEDSNLGGNGQVQKSYKAQKQVLQRPSINSIFKQTTVNTEVVKTINAAQKTASTISLSKTIPQQRQVTRQRVDIKPQVTMQKTFEMIKPQQSFKQVSNLKPISILREISKIKPMQQNRQVEAQLFKPKQITSQKLSQITRSDYKFISPQSPLISSPKTPVYIIPPAKPLFFGLTLPNGGKGQSYKTKKIYRNELQDLLSFVSNPTQLMKTKNKTKSKRKRR